ncbi:MAG: CBS domain-containing protein [Anaerolineae bacterium]|nr:CBS domain-containing protein [Anaerolineae bacterium]
MTDHASVEVSKLQELVYELKIEDVMKRDVITVTPQTSMREFKELLRLKRISGTPVVEGDTLVGIISLEDLIKALEDGEMDNLVESKMTSNVETLFSDDPAVQAVNRMARFGYGRFPVLDRSGKLVGILTRGDMLRGLLRRLEVNYREEEIQRYRASHIFQDIVSDRTSLILRYQIEGKDFRQGGAASSKIKRAIERLGGGPSIARRVGVAAYEAEMNLVIHTDQGGEMRVEIHPSQVYILAEDHGPGISDIEQALQPGFSTAPEWIREMGFGAGMGLLNIKHCTDGMKLNSQLGVGTRLEMWFHIPPPEPAPKQKEDLL